MRVCCLCLVCSHTFHGLVSSGQRLGPERTLLGLVFWSGLVYIAVG